MAFDGSEDDRIIGLLYEAAVAEDRWPDALQAVASRVGARGGTFIVRATDGVRWTASPSIARDVEDYIAGGWAMSNHATPLLADLHPGFRAETDYRTIDEIEHLPVHATFLSPRGYIASAASVLQGIGNQVLQIAFEGFASHPAAAAAVPILDRFRPHFGRALGLTAAMHGERAMAFVKGLEVGGIGAAVVERNGRIRAANTRFETCLGSYWLGEDGGIHSAEQLMVAKLADVLSTAAGEDAKPQSLPLRRGRSEPPLVVHILPLSGLAQPIVESDGLLFLISEVGNTILPDADLLRLLFDLTPAEARLARRLAEGMSLDEAARANSIGRETAKTHLQRLFVKTGTMRQVALVQLLASLRGLPDRALSDQVMDR